MSDILRVYEEDGSYWVEWYGKLVGALLTNPRLDLAPTYGYVEHFHRHYSQRYSMSFDFIEAPRPVKQKRKRKQSDLGLRRPK